MWVGAVITISTVVGMIRAIRAITPLMRDSEGTMFVP